MANFGSQYRPDADCDATILLHFRSSAYFRVCAGLRDIGKAQSSYEPYNLNVPVVIVSSEIAPWSKTGGLGLVAASYGYEFARKGHRTMAALGSSGGGPPCHEEYRLPFRSS